MNSKKGIAVSMYKIWQLNSNIFITALHMKMITGVISEFLIIFVDNIDPSDPLDKEQ